ncbi:MAG: glycosyl hydrolase, partial [Caulobacterales bacterium]|nr:glycosyl hydrolase [Caulobacterales bacterium]
MRVLRQAARRAVTAAAALTAAVAGLPAAAQDLALGSDVFGNIFHQGEEVRLNARGRFDSYSWTARNAFGEAVASGQGRFDGRRASIAPADLPLGYYELTVSALGRGGAREAKAPFAVIPTPRETEGYPFGVMTHFAQNWNTDIIPLIRKAGVWRVRDELYWGRVEPRQRLFELPRSYRDYLAELDKHEVEPLIVLSFANDLYDDGHTPHTPDGIRAFGRYADFITREMEGRVEALEVWNEYNGSFCKGPCREDRPRYYDLLLEESFNAIRHANPDITVVGGAVVTIPVPYLRELFERGALDRMDAVAVHPYGSNSETVGLLLDDVRRDMDAHGGSKPIWVTEMGRSSHTEEGRPDLAKLLVRINTAMLAADVEQIYWYLLRDYQNFRGMGLLRGPDSEYGRYTPTPSYAAFAHLTHQLGPATYQCRAALDPRTFVHRFASERDVQVAWSLHGPAAITIVAGGEVEVRDYMGGTRQVLTAGQSARLDLSEEPIYVVGPLAD